tara:strand:+ start:145 stop:1083 length:939 start_codon:yes stop_codon:yes gene_type:complete
MKKILIFFLTFFFTNLTFAADEKPGRFFEDQPDVTDDYQIHFNYLLAADSEDREMDINGEMEKILLEANEVMLKATAENKKGDGVARKYKFDYRPDGKLDITFIRMDMKHKELHKWANNDIIPFLNNVKGQKNIKKIYYNLADFSNVDGGEAGVGYGTTYLKSNSNSSYERKLLVTLHELLHTQGMGYDCVPGVKSGNGHYSTDKRGYMLESGRKIGSVYAHTSEGCPQMMDSIYLTPTRSDPYDPYVLTCLLDLGKYNHPKLLKKLDKIKKKADKKIKGNLRFGTSCRYRDWERAKGGYYIWGVKDNIAAR